MASGLTSPRPPQITRSAYISAFIALLPLAFTAQAQAHGADVGIALSASVVIAAGGFLCTFLLLSLNRFARLAFVAVWLMLLGAAGYSWAYLRHIHDYRGAMALVALASCGLVLWNTINRNWPRGGERPTASLSHP